MGPFKANQTFALKFFVHFGQIFRILLVQYSSDHIYNMSDCIYVMKGDNRYWGTSSTLFEGKQVLIYVPGHIQGFRYICFEIFRCGCKYVGNLWCGSQTTVGQEHLTCVYLVGGVGVVWVGVVTIQ